MREHLEHLLSLVILKDGLLTLECQAIRKILVNYTEFEKPQMVCLGDG